MYSYGVIVRIKLRQMFPAALQLVVDWRWIDYLVMICQSVLFSPTSGSPTVPGVKTLYRGSNRYKHMTPDNMLITTTWYIKFTGPIMEAFLYLFARFVRVRFFFKLTVRPNPKTLEPSTPLTLTTDKKVYVQSMTREGGFTVNFAFI